MLHSHLKPSSCTKAFSKNLGNLGKNLSANRVKMQVIKDIRRWMNSEVCPGVRTMEPAGKTESLAAAQSIDNICWLTGCSTQIKQSFAVLQEMIFPVQLDQLEGST